MAKKTETPSDGLTQAHREAIVDLMLFAMYEDNRIAQKEDEMISRTLRSMHWESGTAAETYASMATARVRAARASADGRNRFLTQLNVRLATPEAKAKALQVCQELLLADESESPEEAAFEVALKAALGVA